MLQILTGDCRATLAEVGDGPAQCCVTSPPYWGLRDYGTATWEGGSADCDHLADRSAYETHFADSKQAPNKGTGNRDIIPHGVCPNCGAIRIDSQLGLEANPQDYVDAMVGIFKEVKRVLRKDGTLWLNLGDTYSTQRWTKKGETKTDAQPMNKMKDTHRSIAPIKESGLPDKNLVGIPWRVAFALQADGWYLRQDIIWHKPNPMPEPVTDRCTKSHEYMFLFSQSPKYYYNHEAISEPAVYAGDDRGARTDNRRGEPMCNSISGATGEMRNKRSVWSITTKPYKDAHFAAFPEDLISPCILAGSKAGDVILDPFAGSGTTGKVAINNGRKALLCELNPDYVNLIKQRTNTTIGFGF